MYKARLFYTIPAAWLASCLALLMTGGPALSYDEFLFGPPHQIKIWTDNNPTFGEGSIKSAPGIVLGSEVLIDSLLYPALSRIENRGLRRSAAQSGLVHLNQIDPELARVIPEQRTMRDKISLTKLTLLQTMQRQKDYPRYLTEYVSHLYKAETRKKNTDMELLVRRVRELHVQQSDDYLLLAKILLEASSLHKEKWRLTSLDKLVLERWLAIDQDKDPGEVAVDITNSAITAGVKTALSDLTYQNLLSYLLQCKAAGKAPASDKLNDYIRKTLIAYDSDAIENLFYSVPARLKIIRLSPELYDGQSQRILDAMRMRERFDRPNIGDLVDEVQRQTLSQLNALALKIDDADAAESGNTPLDPAVSATLHKLLDRMTVIAYLYKVDQRPQEAGRLYRLIYTYTKKYFADDNALLGAVAYDLAENAMWSENFDESIFYFERSVQSRLEKAAYASEARNTQGMLGRIYINKWDNDGAREYYFKILEAIAKLPPRTDGEDDVQRVESLCQACLVKWTYASPEMRKHIDDSIQGLADASVNGKRYDIARVCDRHLLTIKQKAVPDDRAGVMSVYWQMAWSEQNALDFERSATAYSALIRDYGDEPPSTLAMWYQARAQCYDLLGKFDSALDDFRKAIYYLKINYKTEEDPVAKDHIYWNMADIRYNMTNRYLIYKPHYDDGLYTCFFSHKKFPLKVFLADDRKNGFGGELREMMLKAISEWTDFKDSPIKVKFVDDSKDADIFVERVTTYNDIPLGSAGRSSARYVRDPESHDDTRELERIHIRCYCESYDGVSGQKLSPFARVHLYTLFIHEFGHAIGLPHSPNGLDVMYWKACATKPSSRDKETIKRIYSTLEKELAAKKAAKAH